MVCASARERSTEDFNGRLRIARPSALKIIESFIPQLEIRSLEPTAQASFHLCAMRALLRHRNYFFARSREEKKNHSAVDRRF